MEQIVDKYIVGKMEEGDRVKVYVFLYKNTTGHRCYTHYAVDDKNNILQYIDDEWEIYTGTLPTKNTRYNLEGVMINNEFYCNNILSIRGECVKNIPYHISYFKLGSIVNSYDNTPFEYISNKKDLLTFLDNNIKCDYYLVGNIKYSQEELYTLTMQPI
jgi:hypothetical protein